MIMRQDKYRAKVLRRQEQLHPLRTRSATHQARPSRSYRGSPCCFLGVQGWPGPQGDDHRPPEHQVGSTATD
jgi:hypothetical protein